MVESRYDEARRCPACALPGELDSKLDQKDHNGKSTVYTFKCRNPRCRDNGFGWLIQVLSSNEIPLKTERRERWDKWARKYRPEVGRKK
jgi:hypothetical protein